MFHLEKPEGAQFDSVEDAAKSDEAPGVAPIAHCEYHSKLPSVFRFREWEGTKKETFGVMKRRLC